MRQLSPPWYVHVCAPQIQKLSLGGQDQRVNDQVVPAPSAPGRPAPAPSVPPSHAPLAHGQAVANQSDVNWRDSVELKRHYDEAWARFACMKHPAHGVLSVVNVDGKGNCLFLATGLTLNAPGPVVRAACVGFMRAHCAEAWFQTLAHSLAGVVPSQLGAYLDSMAKDLVFGGSLEIMAMALNYRRQIVVLCGDGSAQVYPDDVLKQVGCDVPGATEVARSGAPMVYIGCVRLQDPFESNPSRFNHFVHLRRAGPEGQLRAQSPPAAMDISVSGCPQQSLRSDIRVTRTVVSMKARLTHPG